MVISDIEKLKLSSLGVNALILFGSQAQGLANSMSDYDLFVIGPKDQKVYDSVYELVSEKINKPVDIDIVFEETSPMELQNHVAKYGKVLYQKNESIFANFKQRVMLSYSDFSVHRAIYSNATLARI